MPIATAEYAWPETPQRLWSDLRIAAGQSEVVIETLDWLGLAVGIYVECPDCGSVVEAGDTVGPCADCEE
jgi:hypothetical protein